VTTRIVTISELKARQSPLIAELEEQGISLYITRHGKPKAVLAHYDEYEALVKKAEDLEDLLVMKDSLLASKDEVIGLDDYEQQRKCI
jgi:prevent-host-death family protein